MPAINASTSNEVRLGSKANLVKNPITPFHHSGIIDIYILHKKPSPDAVIGQSAVLSVQLPITLLEQVFGLTIRALRVSHSTTKPQMGMVGPLYGK